MTRSPPVPIPASPGANDRETVILKSGPNKGKPWRRKPRLQARLPGGYKVGDIRRALGVALALSMGEITVSLEDGRAPKAKERIRGLNDEIARLRAAMSVVAMDPLPHGVRNVDEALFVLGFPPGSKPNQTEVKARFRMLATIHHPGRALRRHAAHVAAQSGDVLAARGRSVTVLRRRNGDRSRRSFFSGFSGLSCRPIWRPRRRSG